ncbi:hypothetical protein PA7_28460 [Pseudonocardia asaccharolytica DSM 44247 = NBRC 16224]|uniref:Uncharacterized protein n=1 Tax=Pseudonocardia asaccharolytica DSM 44247 = NBRC 16224 TaxID=1123024 RepID=A0A511D2J0_9PSEU|nr:hypothetical protein PA7_28460 [Pseudonocardia asaccharolytica DSM 44247 = NBRC 16224]
MDDGAAVTLHTDIPSRAEIDALFQAKERWCVSFYLPTDPVSTGEGERLELKNLVRDALNQMREAEAGKNDIAAVEEQLIDLDLDETFWRHQARSLALFATPSALVAFRLPNRLLPLAAVADRFHLKPLLRAITFPQLAFVLAVTQNAVRVLEILPDVDAEPVDVPNLPTDLESAVGKEPLADQMAIRRMSAAEEQKVRMRQYARQIDQALRPILPEHGVPLLLAAPEPLGSIVRSACRYPGLAAAALPGNPDVLPDAELVASAREVLDRLYADQMSQLRELFGQRSAQGRAVTDVADVARLATHGAVETVFADIDVVVPGHLDEAGAVTFEESDDATAYGVVDEIVRRVWLTGGRVLALRREDIPGGGDVAAILRYSL